jgi:AcrR family transcriptional regulator
MDHHAAKVKANPYDAELRRRRSAETKQRIVDAARELILDHGYRATTMTQIAARARVNVDTIYELTGRKALLLRELIEQAISGVDHAVVAEERSHIIAMRKSTDPVEKLRIYARAMRQTQARLAPLFLALRDASSTDLEALAVWQGISDRRARNMRKFVRDLRDAGGLRSDLSENRAADVVWAINSPELFDLFVNERGWSLSSYEGWLLDTLCRLLIPETYASTSKLK